MRAPILGCEVIFGIRLEERIQQKKTRQNAHFLKRVSICLAGRIRPIFVPVDMPRRTHTISF